MEKNAKTRRVGVSRSHHAVAPVGEKAVTERTLRRLKSLSTNAKKRKRNHLAKINDAGIRDGLLEALGR